MASERDQENPTSGYGGRHPSELSKKSKILMERRVFFFSDRIAHCKSNVPQYGILLLNRKMLKIG